MARQQARQLRRSAALDALTANRFPQKWAQNGHSDFRPTQNPEAFQIRDSLIIKKNYSKEDSNLHRLTYWIISRFNWLAFNVLHRNI
jgi:hypothetical protein